HPDPHLFPYTTLFRSYATSKSGLLNFTRSAAMDLARHGIRVNSLTPTATDPDEGAERAVAWGRARPERRAGPLDFAKMVPMQKRSEEHTSELQSRSDL